MRKLTFVSISIYMFCFLSSCAAANHNFDEVAWKEHLLERERLLDRSPTFLEVNGKNMKERINWVWKEPSRPCTWNPYECFKTKMESSK